MDNRILLVDDEAGIRRVLAIALKDAGYRITTAASAKEALEVCRLKAPPIILTDIKMPGMDGIELLRTIKKEHPEIEVIMITGHGDIDLAIRSLKFEATDFITKPINDEVLEIALKRAEERIAMRAKLRAYTENLEELVEEKSRQLVAAERMAAVGETVAGLSHGIKNIASGLKGGAFVLEKGIELDDRTFLLDGWEMVKGNVDKIANLSLELLNYSKTADVKLKRGHPNDPVREVFKLMLPVAKENGIALTLALSSELKPFDFDPEGIHRCLLNLVTNAVDACLDGGAGNTPAEVRLETRRVKGWAVEYRVADTGCGMSTGTLEKIFQVFFTTKGTRGTGIGLMSSKKIIDKHRGTITVTSSIGSGSTFILRLPQRE